MDISSASIGAISASIGVPLFLWLMRSFNKLAPTATSPKTLEQLSHEYSGWEKLSAIATMVFTAIIALLLWKLFTFSAGFRFAHLAGSNYLLTPPDALWALPALFLGIFIAVIPLQYLMEKLLGKERYLEFIDYGNRKTKLNTWKLFSYMAYFFIPLALAFSVLSFDSYLRVTDKAIVVNRFFSIGAATYRFTDITKIELTKSFKAPNGNIVHREFYTLTFNDGTEYGFHNSVLETPPPLQSEITRYLAFQSGLAITVEDPYPE